MITRLVLRPGVRAALVAPAHQMSIAPKPVSGTSRQTRLAEARSDGGRTGTSAHCMVFILREPVVVSNPRA